MATSEISKGQPGSKRLFKDTYLLHKLHSLTGVLPIGLFLIFHLTANAYSLRGAVEFDTAVRAIGYAPFILLLEAGVIFLPILFHAIYGLMIVAEMPGPGGNVAHYGYERNWLYVMQRWTGVIAIVYLAFHVYDTTALKYYYEAIGGVGSHELGFQSISYRAMAWRFANVPYLLFYIVGITSACLHLGNGLFNFSIRWGLAIGAGAQKASAAIGWTLGGGLALLGIIIAVNFASKGKVDAEKYKVREDFVRMLVNQNGRMEEPAQPAVPQPGQPKGDQD
jgi:succinate dehydrogenase / fumarate reductase cytochrome b subunit